MGSGGNLAKLTRLGLHTFDMWSSRTCGIGQKVQLPYGIDKHERKTRPCLTSKVIMKLSWGGGYVNT